jgi:hypothetical protein
MPGSSECIANCGSAVGLATTVEPKLDRLHRAVLSHSQAAVSLGAVLREPRTTTVTRARCLPRSIQPRVAHRTAPLSVPAAGSRARPWAPASCMIMVHLMSKKSGAEQMPQKLVHQRFLSTYSKPITSERPGIATPGISW